MVPCYLLAVLCLAPRWVFDQSVAACDAEVLARDQSGPLWNWVLKLVVCLVYFRTGLAKLMADEISVLVPDYLRAYELSARGPFANFTGWPAIDLAAIPDSILMAGGALALALELSAPLALFDVRIGRAIGFGLMFMHLAIFASMHILFFDLIICVPLVLSANTPRFSTQTLGK